jgi:hypothetical protein
MDGLEDPFASEPHRAAIKSAVLMMRNRIRGDNHFVHGDVRRANVLLSPQKLVECVTRAAALMDADGVERAQRLAQDIARHALQLIDFDWAGVSGVVRYPFGINMTDIEWLPGVAPLAAITIEQQRQLIELEF